MGGRQQGTQTAHERRQESAKGAVTSATGSEVVSHCCGEAIQHSDSAGDEDRDQQPREDVPPSRGDPEEDVADMLD